MSNNFNANVDMESAFNADIKMEDISMVFGTPDSPKGAANRNFHIAIETNESKDTHIPNEQDNNSSATTHPAHSLLAAANDSTLPDITTDGTEKEEHEESPHAHDFNNSTHEENGGTDDGKWWSFVDPHYSDSPGDVPALSSRFNTEEPSPLASQVTPDVNAYQQRKNLAHGMMDLALLSANANQLRYVMECTSHPNFYPNIIFISFSILLQVVVGVLLIWNSQYDSTKKAEVSKAIKVNNVTVLGVFLVTIANVFIPSFSVAPLPIGSNDIKQAIHQAG